MHFSLYVGSSHPEVTLRFTVTLKIFFVTQSCSMPSYMVLESMVPELHDIRIVCLLKVITHRGGSFKLLQAKVKCFCSAGPVRMVPRTLNKQPKGNGLD